MNTALIIRIAKIAALFCFVLPWFMISCAGTPIPGSNIAGYELITGHSQASSQMAQQMGGSPGSGSIAGGNIMYQLPFIIAAAAIGLGLLFSFTLRGAAAGRVTLITSGGALAAVIAGYLLLQNAIKSGMGQASSSMGAQSPFGSTGGGDFSQFNAQMNQMSQALVANIDLQPQMGYWLEIVCLVIAGMFSFLLMRGQEALGAAGGGNMSFGAGASSGGARTPDAIAWESMNQFDTDQLADFLMKYPGSRFAATAQANLARISAGGGTAPDADSDMWGRIDQNNIDQLADYLMKFPGGRFARTAQAKIQAASAPAPSATPAPAPSYSPPPAAPASSAPVTAAPPSYSDGSYTEPARKGPNLVVVVAVAAVVLGGAVAGGYMWWQGNEKARVEAEAKAAADQAAAAAQAQAAARQAQIDTCTSSAPDGPLDAAINACVGLLWEADAAARDPAVSHINQVAAAAALAARQRIDAIPEMTDLTAFYIDRGLCPGEGCLYGMWTATQQTQLYASPSDPRVIGSIEANERVLAATGEVHTLPIRGRVSAAFEGHNVGDTVILLTDMGEGTFRIWHNGAVAWSTQALNINCDPAAGPDCRRPYDFGDNPQQQSVWWVQVRRQNGETGWIRDAANFTGKSRYE